MHSYSQVCTTSATLVTLIPLFIPYLPQRYFPLCSSINRLTQDCFLIKFKPCSVISSRLLCQIRKFLKHPLLQQSPDLNSNLTRKLCSFSSSFNIMNNRTLSSSFMQFWIRYPQSTETLLKKYFGFRLKINLFVLRSSVMAPRSINKQ